MEFIRGTTLVHLKVRCWSGEKKASRDLDIQLGKDGKIPPQKMLDLGRKKIFPPTALDPMNNKRKAAATIGKALSRADCMELIANSLLEITYNTTYCGSWRGYRY